MMEEKKLNQSSVPADSAEEEKAIPAFLFDGTTPTQTAPAEKKIRQKEKKPFRFPYFWVIYGVLFVAFAVLLGFGAKFLTSYLTAFEASQPIHCAEEVFQRYFSGDDMMDALIQAGYEDGTFETVEAASKKLMAQREGKEISFYSGATIDELLCYNVVLTDPAEEMEETETGLIPPGSPKKIASFYLKKQDVADEYGNVGYEFSHLEVFVTADEKVKVIAPKEHKLFLNGVEVGEDYVTETDESHVYNSAAPENANKIVMLTYEVDGLYLAPELSMTDRFGKPQELTYSQEDGAETAPFVYDEDLKEQYSQRIQTGMQEFAKYIQNDGWTREVRKYFDQNSELYRNIIDNPYYFVIYHDSYSFQNVSLTDFYRLDENTFCCHVVMDHVLHRQGREDYVDHIDNVVYLKKIGDEYYIYQRVVL